MMTPDRFRRLAEAYGGDFARWPARDRGPAAAFVAAHASQAAAVLSAERTLDVGLDAYAVPPPTPQLRERVLASARPPRPVRAWRLAVAAGLGLGLAGSAAAGVAAGFTLAPPPVTRLISGPAPSNDALADLVGDAGEG
jgi:hypothetical protein